MVRESKDHDYKKWKCKVLNTLRPRQNGRLFADDIFKSIFLNEKVWISIKISLKFVPKSQINNIPALVQIMAWRRPGDKPLSEPIMVSLLTHICVTRPQWVKLDISLKLISNSDLIKYCNLLFSYRIVLKFSQSMTVVSQWCVQNFKISEQLRIK